MEDLAKNVRGKAGVPEKILEEVSKVVVGKDEIKEMLLVAMLSEGLSLIHI